MFGRRDRGGDRFRPAKGVTVRPAPHKDRADKEGPSARRYKAQPAPTTRRRRSSGVSGVHPSRLLASRLLRVNHVDGAEEGTPVAVLARLL